MSEPTSNSFKGVTGVPSEIDYPTAEPVYNAEDTIYQRIDKAFMEIATKGLKKSKTAGTGSYGYKFIPISDILDVVRSAHAKFGVKVIPSKIMYDKENYEIRETVNGKMHANGHIVFRIVGKSKEDSIETSISCEALDNSDKLTNKLLTNAERGLYRMIYALDEGDDTDPEAFHIKLNEEGVKKAVSSDPFFGSSSSAKAGNSISLESAKADPNSKSELNEIFGAKYNAKTRDMVINWQRENKINNLYETTNDQRKQLLKLIKEVE